MFQTKVYETLLSLLKCSDFVRVLLILYYKVGSWWQWLGEQAAGQEGCRSICGMGLVQWVLLMVLMPIGGGEGVVLLVSFDFPVPLKILIVSYRVEDMDERWADFSWLSW